MVAGNDAGEGEGHLISVGSHHALQHHMVRVDLAMEVRVEDFALLLSGQRAAVLLQDELLLTNTADVVDGHVPGAGKVSRGARVYGRVIVVAWVAQVFGNGLGDDL